MSSNHESITLGSLYSLCFYVNIGTVTSIVTSIEHLILYCKYKGVTEVSEIESVLIVWSYQSKKTNLL